MGVFEDSIYSIQTASNGEEVRDAIVEALQACHSSQYSISESVIDGLVQAAYDRLVSEIPSIAVDSALSANSNNPVRNSVIYAALQNIEQRLIQNNVMVGVDTTFSSTSQNPVANNVLKGKFDSIESSILALNASIQDVQSSITLDNYLNISSDNAVKNRTVTRALNDMATQVNIVKSIVLDLQRADTTKY